MPSEEHYRKLERMYASAPINDYYRPTLHIEEGRSELVVAVRRDFHHAAHAVHGSVYFKMLDDAAFFAANSVVEDVFVLTTSFNIQLLRPVVEGEMRAVGRLVHASRRQWIADAEAWDGEGRLFARGSGVFMASRIPLTPDVGYR